MHHLSGCLHCQLCLPPSIGSLLRCCGVCFLIIKSDSDVVVAIVVKQPPPPDSLPPLAPFDVLHFLRQAVFILQLELKLETTRVEMLHSCRRRVKAVKIFFIPLFA